MRALLIISIGLNLVLTAWWARLKPIAHQTLERSIRSSDAHAGSAIVSRTNERVIVVPGDDGSPWSALDSRSYEECIARLRAAGCPEETIRDIIIANVSRRHRKQMLADYEESTRKTKWWRGIQDDDVHSSLSAMREVRLARDAELTRLFGDKWREDAAKRTGLFTEGKSPSMLSPKKRMEMAALNAKYAGLEDEVRHRVRGGFLLEEEEADLEKLKKEKRAELAQLLTPQELEDFDARNSPAASWVHQKLPSALSEEEFKTMVRIAQGLGKDMQSEHALKGGETADEAVKRRAAEDQALREQFRTALGDARTAELFPEKTVSTSPQPQTFEQSAERARKEIVKFAQGEGVSTEAANEAHTRLIAVIKEFERKVGSLDKMSPEQSEEFSRTLKAKGEQIFIETMGEKGKKIFRRVNHDD